MKFLHTADIHLKKGEVKRTEVLKWLIKKAEELNIDYFIIAGDLFESDTDATIMRSELKRIFEETEIKFIIVPGNHDAESFSRDYDYGSNVIQLTETPFETVELDGLKVCGVPYQNKKFSECMKNLPGKIDILIAHGTLYDETFIYSMLDDEETEYMPIYPANLENTARYVAMGHLHSRNIETKYKGTQVVYPGAPIALDTKCVGKRYFYFLDIDENKLKMEHMKVGIAPYWSKKEFFVFPGNEEKILLEIKTYLVNVDAPDIMPHITVKGFIGEKDMDFKNRLAEIGKKSEKFNDMKMILEIQSWDKIIQNQVVKNFINKTMSLDNIMRMKVFEITFPIFNEVLK